jgi:Fanconi anemia group M protein
MESPALPKYIEHPLIWPHTIEFRLYQKNIATAALKQNTLVILPTALGKTVISAIIAADMLYLYPNTKILVMAPTRPLVLQHRRRFHQFLKLRSSDTLLLTGTTPPSQRKPLWDSNIKVYFATPQVVRNDLASSSLSLTNFSLLIFDESHRAVKNYAYTDIAKQYIATGFYPLILGLTASPGPDLQRVLEVCSNLYIEHMEHRSEKDVDVIQYLQPINIEWKRVTLPPEYVQNDQQIDRMLHRRLSWLYSNRLLKRRPEYATKSMVIALGTELRSMLNETAVEERGRIYSAIINQSMVLTLYHMKELLETQGIHAFMPFLKKIEREKTRKKSYNRLVNEPEYQNIQKRVSTHQTPHPKIPLLKQLVLHQLQTNPSSRILVFTQFRDTARYLVNEFNAFNKQIRAKRFVGQTNKLRDKGLSQDQQASRIEELKQGALNVLVATSIAEEGLDIPAIDHVFFYEPIPSGIRYIQRRGRTGRKSPGKVTILAADNSLDMIYLYASTRRVKKMLKMVQNVNTKLHKIMRLRPKPPATPMTPQDIQHLEQEAKHDDFNKPNTPPELEAIQKQHKQITKASQKTYLKLLETGEEGLGSPQLEEEMKREGIPPNTLQSALNSLQRKKLITQNRFGHYLTRAAQDQGETFDIQIEKILSGSAIVLVNNQWRARLSPENYDGPRSLIKKNKKLRVTANLFRVAGTLCIRIKSVKQTLN